MSKVAEDFMSTLKELERERDVERLVPLFSEKSELQRAPRSHIYRGRDGARQFWSEYLDAFATVETDFREVTHGDGRVVMEWHSVATSKQGRPIEYDGCTILESRDGSITGFRTYYDATSTGMGTAPSKS